MKTLKWEQIPKCDLCGATEAIAYDAPTKIGPWAHMCPECYAEHKTVFSEAVGFKIILKDS